LPFKCNLQRYKADELLDPNRELLPLTMVALQVAFERQTLKPVFHSIGYVLWVNLIQRAAPHPGGFRLVIYGPQIGYMEHMAVINL
jgi:hypothetical protein